MKKSIEEATKDILYAIEQANGEKASTILNESYPYTTGMTLTVCSKPRMVLLGGMVVAREAQSQTELAALLSGEEPEKYPNYNIDWDTRSDVSGRIFAMGTIDFDTVEEGAMKLSEAIEEKVPKGCWAFKA